MFVCSSLGQISVEKNTFLVVIRFYLGKCLYK